MGSQWQRPCSKPEVNKLWLIVFVTKDLLEHRHVHLFTVAYGCCHAAKTELSSYVRDSVVHKA